MYLDVLDKIKNNAQVISEMIQEIESDAPEHTADLLVRNARLACLNDNLNWIQQAAQHKLVVGSQARILYSDQRGRLAIALAINSAIAARHIGGPVVLSRDHHDVSGTDSPYRETADVRDGSSFCADMAIHNVIGGSFRGATYVSIHNGGGTGWGEAINGGFGLVLDGSIEASKRASSFLHWDVFNGITRRAWAGNRYAQETLANNTLSAQHSTCFVPTLAHSVNSELIARVVVQAESSQ